MSDINSCFVNTTMRSRVLKRVSYSKGLKVRLGIKERKDKELLKAGKRLSGEGRTNPATLSSWCASSINGVKCLK